MQFSRLVPALSLALSAALAAAPVFAATKVMTGPTTKTPETRDGVKGSWHEYVEYTYESIADRLKEIYTKELGGDWSNQDFSALIPKIQSGQMTYDQLTAQLREAKGLLASNDNLAVEWHSRDFDMALLRSNFGYTGGWIDQIPATAHAADYPKTLYSQWDGGGDGMSIIGQSTRLLKLATMMESGILPSGVFDIQGVFTHYYATVPTSPYFSALPRTGSYNGGDWNAVYSVGSREQDVFTWYSQYWGYGMKIDMKDVTAAQLRAAAQAIYNSAASTGSPIALDLSGNDQIGVTGRSTARDRHDLNTFVRDGSVVFDLFGNGKPIRHEWMNQENDALLVDDRKGEVTKAAQGDGVISGKVLFGNAGGFDNGYIKLALILLEHNRYASAGKEKSIVQTALRGSGLEGLKAWVDRNHDAKVQPGELLTLSSLGITELEVFPKRVKNAQGESLIQSSYVQDGKKKLAEDVWFALDPDEKK